MAGTAGAVVAMTLNVAASSVVAALFLAPWSGPLVFFGLLAWAVWYWRRIPDDAHKKVNDVNDVNDDNKQIILEAIEELDAVWRFDAERGKQDSWGGMEYRHQSTAYKLRRVLWPDIDERWAQELEAFGQKLGQK